MSDKTGIEWTDATWNPVAGCSIVSKGCTNCYAMKMAARIEAMGNVPHYAGLTQPSKGGPVWTGKMAIAPDHILTQPLRWKKPRKIFVNSMSDLFHEGVPDAVIDRVFAVMALAPQHTFQVLTKRPERMRAYLAGEGTKSGRREQLRRTMVGMKIGYRGDSPAWPLPNVWLGVSVEDQATADQRIPLLLDTPAAVRFISAEPLLGPVDLEAAWHGENALDSECWGDCTWCTKGHTPLHNCQLGRGDWLKGRSGLDWVIVGGESGPGARPMHPDWARSLRDQCAAAGVAFLFKQWGAWAPIPDRYENHPRSLPLKVWTGEGWTDDGAAEGDWMAQIGKKRAGRLLDGVEHNGYPHAGDR